MGADSGVLLCDMGFAGADVLATSYTISEGIKALGDFDLIICGKQTTDGDTAQVGPAIAEHLGIPHVTWVSEIESSDRKRPRCQNRIWRTASRWCGWSTPASSPSKKTSIPPRLPSYLNLLKTKDWPVKNPVHNRPSWRQRKQLRPQRLSYQGRAHICSFQMIVDQVMWDCADSDCAQEACTKCL